MASSLAGLFRFTDFQILDSLFEFRSFDNLPVSSCIPRAGGIGFSFVTLAGGIVEVLVDQSWRGVDLADGKAVFAQALERRGERLHVCDFASHEELQCVFRPGIVAEVDEALVDNLGPSLGGNVAA